MTTWIEACQVDDVDEEDVIGFEHEGAAYAIFRSPEGAFYATAGACTHEQVKLADGLVMDCIIECPKHNGRFDYTTGAAKGAPVINALRTYAVKVEGNAVFLNVGAE